MEELILEHWLDVSFGVLVTVLAIVFRKISKYFKEQKCESDAIKQGVQAILHDRLYSAHKDYVARGCCSLEDKRNINHIYMPYIALGGNGAAEQAYKDIIQLPATPQAPQAQHVSQASQIWG